MPGANPILSRQNLYLRPNPARVVVRPFRPATEPRDLNPTDKTRAIHIVERVMALDHATLVRELRETLENFQDRHRNLLQLFEARSNEMEDALTKHQTFSKEQCALIGAYFMLEYSFESAALFNPSIVADIDQSAALPGSLRFILSLRAVGEGHISSLTFRSGSIDANGIVSLDPQAALASIPKVSCRAAGSASSEVNLTFCSVEDISERVIFPVTDAQSNGIEDARFVVFDDDGKKTYYATFTAYNGRSIRSELIATTDFLSFRMSTLGGSAALNKGMALFPKRIDGRYAMIGRQDNENLYLILSEDLYTWNGGVAILKPMYP